MSQKWYYLLICIVFQLFFLIPLYSETIAAPPDNYYDSDAGSIFNPFQISSLANLRWLSETPQIWFVVHNQILVYQYFLQTTDIDASETVNWNNGEGFRPIGRFSNTEVEASHTYYFHGQYDGNNYKISNLYLSPNDYTAINPITNQSNGYAFFDHITNASLQNIVLENIYYLVYSEFLFNESKITGIVSDAMYSTVSNCGITGKIDIIVDSIQINTSNIFVSSLANLLDHCYIENCYSTTDISIRGDTPSLIVSGLASILLNSTLMNSFYYGDIIPESQIKISGLAYIVANHSRIEKCYFTCNYPMDEAYAISTYLIDSEILYSFWDKEVSRVDNMVEINSNSIITNCFGYRTEEMKQASSFFNWDFEYIWGINSGVNNGYPFLRNLFPPVVKSVDHTKPSIQIDFLTNYPNPFNPLTTISFATSVAANIQIDIYNIKGQKIRSLYNDYTAVGNHQIQWNGKDDYGQQVGSGVYLYRLISDTLDRVQKMILLK